MSDPIKIEFTTEEIDALLLMISANRVVLQTRKQDVIGALISAESKLATILLGDSRDPMNLDDCHEIIADMTHELRDLRAERTKLLAAAHTLMDDVASGPEPMGDWPSVYINREVWSSFVATVRKLES